MKFLLALFFLLMYAGNRIGLNVSLAPGLSIKNLLLYLVLTGIAVNAAVARNRKVELAGPLAMFGLLILYAVLTWVTLVFVVQDPEYEIKGAIVALKANLVDQFLTLLIFFYGLLQLKDAMWLLRAILWIAMLGNVITIVDTMNIPDLGLLPVPRKGGRFEGFIGQPNEYGLFLSLYLPLCVALLLELRGKARMLAGVGVFATALALVLTGSRGAYVGIVAGAIVAAFYLRRYVSAQTVVRTASAVAVFCVAIMVTAVLTGYADLFFDRFSGIEGNPHVATSGRSSIWKEAIESMLENPLSFVSGYGFHSYASDRSFRLATHNLYLYYLYELGTIGLVLFVGIFARILSTARAAITVAAEEQRRHLSALVFGLSSFLIASIFNEYHDAGYLLWAYVGVSMRVAMCELARGTAGAEETTAVTAPAAPAPPGRAEPVAPARARPAAPAGHAHRPAFAPRRPQGGRP
jgi:O-antigen ligase